MTRMDWRPSALAQRMSLTAKVFKLAVRVSFQTSFVAMKQKKICRRVGGRFMELREPEAKERNPRSEVRGWREEGKKDRTGE